MRLSISILIAAAIAALAVPAAAPASGGGGGGISSAGKCTAASSSKIKVRPRDGRLEVEFEVDQNRNGVKWNVRLKDNSTVVFLGSAITKGPSGSFSIERKINDTAGSDVVTGIGRNPKSGERCVARVTV
jgi:hypothetical protein